MTDKEIIKALECCASESIEYCQVCPYMFDTILWEQIKQEIVKAVEKISPVN